MKILNYEVSKTTIAKFKIEYNDARYEYTEWLNEKGKVIDHQIVNENGMIPDNYDELIELIEFHLEKNGY